MQSGEIYVRTRGTLEVHESESTLRTGKRLNFEDVCDYTVVCFIGSEEYIFQKVLSYSSKDYSLHITEEYGSKALYVRKIGSQAFNIIYSDRLKKGKI
jgi:hypothetical protein